MLDSNLEFRTAESWAWIAKSEFSGAIGNSCIEVNSYNILNLDKLLIDAANGRLRWTDASC